MLLNDKFIAPVKVLLFEFALCLIIQATKADGKLNFVDHAKELGLQCEQFDVTTEDGYILGIHRINGKDGPQNSSIPVLMWHGATASSSSFLIRGIKSTAVALAEAGYDVWLGNSRGNLYSRRHKTLNPDKDSKFWDFSFHEMGFYDLPATIDFILKETGFNKLSAIGHSQGNTIFYILGSTRPEYNDKIQVLIALAPFTQAQLDTPLGVVTSLLADRVTEGSEVFGVNSKEIMITQFVCSQTAGYELCVTLIMAFIGNDAREINREIFREALKYYFGGSSLKNSVHFGQVMRRNRFANYDYGAASNLEKYGSAEPPIYDLSKVTMPIAMLQGRNDKFSTLESVAKLREMLPNVLSYTVMDRKEYNHMDFIWGKHIDVDLNPLVEDLLEECD